MPSFKTITLSQNEAANESCVTIKIVAPSDFLACSNELITALEDLESRFPVGSSARISKGLFMIARATAVLCFSPPEISAGYFILY